MSSRRSHARGRDYRRERKEGVPSTNGEIGRQVYSERGEREKISKMKLSFTYRLKCKETSSLSASASASSSLSTV